MKVISRLVKPDLGIVRVIELADHSGWRGRQVDFMLDTIFGDGALPI